MANLGGTARVGGHDLGLNPVGEASESSSGPVGFFTWDMTPAVGIEVLGEDLLTLTRYQGEHVALRKAIANEP